MMGLGVTDDQRLQALADSLRGRRQAADVFALSTINPLAQAAQGEQKRVQATAEGIGALRRARMQEADRTAREREALAARAEQAEQDRQSREIQAAADRESRERIAGMKAESTSGKRPKEVVELEASRPSRMSGIEKAARFLQAFESGAESGTTRTMLRYLPGTYTDQGAFDQELDAFAERAARAELKAAGEIRPTDADVKGMKEAMFGVGRDEQVNKNLLAEYLLSQIATENQYRSMVGESPMVMPDTAPLEGDWYSQLFGGGEVRKDEGYEYRINPATGKRQRRKVE